MWVGGGADEDLAHVCTVAHGLARGVVGDVTGQFELDRARVDQSPPERLRLLMQSVGDGAPLIAGAISGGGATPDAYQPR